MIRTAIGAALLTSALATPGSTAQTVQDREQARLEKALAGLTPGKPQHCIDRGRVSYTKSFEDTILYVQSRNKVWRNTTNGGCAGLADDDIIIWRSPMSEYCAGDIIETRSRSGGVPTGACSLGEFVPYSR